MTNPILINIPELIQTPNLILQMPKAGYGAQLHAAIIDGYEDCVKWLNWPSQIPSVDEVEINCRKDHSKFISREQIVYLIVEKATGDIVGRCSLPSFLAIWQIPQFGISYFIRKTKRGRNYAAESAHALCLLAFDILRAKKVEIHCDAENISSNQIPKKLNFILECTSKGGWPRYDNELADLRTYSLFSADDLPELDVTW